MQGLGLFPGPFYSLLSDTSPATSFCPPKRVNGILGESVILLLVSEATFKRITWSAPTLPRLIVEDERYRGRVRLYGRTYSLEISNLTMADEGAYGVQRVLTMAASVQCYFLFPAPIRAPERLSEPEIRVHPVMAGNGTCNVTFTCSAGERARHLTFTRTRPAGGAILSTEESLLVQHRLGDEDSSITCMATNPVSNSSASASPKVACEGPALPETPALSYCRAKGILVLGVLGTLLAGILTVHVLERRFHWGC
uniref:Ig-like domain-containing protein n=1 Tax=Chelonoidis abingdonii TaxID=106734 RepID=A0A8C0GS38_CHEAB